VELSTSAARSVSVERVAMVEVAVVEIATAAVEVVAIDDGSAGGDVGVVIVDHPMAVPVASPVMPAPNRTLRRNRCQTRFQIQSPPQPGRSPARIPAWIGDEWGRIHEPGIIMPAA